MTFEQLKMLVLVSETSSMKAASEILHVTQQNVSKSLLKLEKELGIKLFERTSKGTILTLEGKKIYEYATRIIHYESLINKEVERKSLKKAKPIYIKVLALDAYSLDLEKAAEQFTTIVPNNHIFIEFTDYIDYKMLLDSEPQVDLILCSLTEADYLAYYEKFKRNYYIDYIDERNLEILFSGNLFFNNRSYVTLKEIEQVTLYNHQRQLERSSYLLKTIEDMGFNSSNVIRLGREQHSMTINNVAMGKGIWLSLLPHLPVLFSFDFEVQRKTIFPLIKMHCIALINKKRREETMQFHQFYKTYLQ